MMNCFLIPESSYQLQATLTQIQELGSSELFVDSHLVAVAKTITAICITTFDTVSYTGKALTGFFIAVIELDFSRSLEELASNSSDAVRSLSMIVILTGFAVSGIFMPRTVFGNFPAFSPPEDFQSQLRSTQAQLEELPILRQQLSETQTRLGAAQTQLGGFEQLSQELGSARAQLAELPILRQQLSETQTRLGGFEQLSQELRLTQAELAKLKKPPMRPDEERKTVVLKVRPSELQSLNALKTRTEDLLTEISKRKGFLISVNEGIVVAQGAIADLQGNPETSAALQEKMKALCQEAEVKKTEFSSSLSEQKDREALQAEIRNLESLSGRMKALIKEGRVVVALLQKELLTLKS